MREDRAQSAPERPVKQECTYGPPNNFDPGPPNNFDFGPPNNSRQSPEPTPLLRILVVWGGGGFTNQEQTLSLRSLRLRGVGLRSFSVRRGPLLP